MGVKGSTSLSTSASGVAGWSSPPRRSFDWAGTVQRGGRIRVATKYVKTAREHFAVKGMHVDLIKLYGSMELAPLVGLADAIVDLVSTGNTLKANDLVAVEEIMPITSRLVVNPGALKLKRRRDAASDRRAGRCRALRRAGRAVRQGGVIVSSEPLRIRRLDTAHLGFGDALGALIAFESAQDPEVDAVVGGHHRRCARAWRRGGARIHGAFRPACCSDGGDAGNSAECDARSARFAARDQRDALTHAAARVRAYHERQKAGSWSFTEPDGTELGQRVTPLDRVGIYVPGGKAAYPSTVLMNAIPAQVAGVREIVMMVPTPDGLRVPLVLAAAHLAGVTRAFTIGGAQAIAALAYGTQTVPVVDKICGPGNAYVAAAKRRVFGTVGIDMVAGVSEVVVVADSSANPDWLAADLFAQAEHDQLAQAILLTPRRRADRPRRGKCQPPAREMPRAEIIRKSLSRRGALVKTRDLAEACVLVNRIAPEHLGLSVAEPEALLPQIRNAGASFLATMRRRRWATTAPAPITCCPTGRTARFSSPLASTTSRSDERAAPVARRRPSTGADRRHARARRRPVCACTLGRSPLDQGVRETSWPRVLAMYKRPADPAAFDRYYYSTHAPIAKKIPGPAATMKSRPVR